MSSMDSGLLAMKLMGASMKREASLMAEVFPDPLRPATTAILIR